MDDKKKPVNPLDSLRDVVGDLWGMTLRTNRENAEQIADMARQLEQDQGLMLPYTDLPDISLRRTPYVMPRRPVNPTAAELPVLSETEAPAAENPAAEAPAEPAKAPEKPALPPFDAFWRAVDETVDWTEALAHAHPTDGLTDAKLWGFFHEHAEGVLCGDMTAYLDVLKEADPLGDLTPYATAFNVHAENPDRLSVSFEALPELMKQEPAEVRRYLAGVCVRATRDLLALLPVREVNIEARHEGKAVLTVPFERAELQKVRLSFADPEQLVIRCGGIFTENDA